MFLRKLFHSSSAYNRWKKHVGQKRQYNCIFTAWRDTSRLLRCVDTNPVAKISAIERVPATFSRMGVGVKAAEA
jgi:hypothetical protein